MIGASDRHLILPELCQRNIRQHTTAIARSVFGLIDRLERHRNAAHGIIGKIDRIDSE
jgi:hypothetical protein